MKLCPFWFWNFQFPATFSVVIVRCGLRYFLHRRWSHQHGSYTDVQVDGCREKQGASPTVAVNQVTWHPGEHDGAKAGAWHGDSHGNGTPAVEVEADDHNRTGEDEAKTRTFKGKEEWSATRVKSVTYLQFNNTSHWKLRVVTIPTLLSLVVLAVVLSSATSDEKFGVMTTLDFQCNDKIKECRW